MEGRGGSRGLTDGPGVQETQDLESLMNGSWVTLCPRVVLLRPCLDTRVVSVLTGVNRGARKAEAQLTQKAAHTEEENKLYTCRNESQNTQIPGRDEGMISLLKEDRSVARRDDLSRPQQPALSTLPGSPLL